MRVGQSPYGRPRTPSLRNALPRPRYKPRHVSMPVSVARPPPALAHPLPAGMRDLLPEEARRRRALARSVLDHFALHGYALVTPPAFELAEVLERGPRRARSRRTCSASSSPSRARSPPCAPT